MTLYLCTEMVTISSRGSSNLSNFRFERQLLRDKHKANSLESSLGYYFPPPPPSPNRGILMKIDIRIKYFVYEVWQVQRDRYQ